MSEHGTKPVPITLKMVENAYYKVRKGGQAVGIDGETWKQFDEKVEDNLYVIWNRLASGTYHPVAVRQTEIPKKDGSKRKLGIPTVRDRIAQCVVKDYMEERIDGQFHENSYGYRPLKSAKQALEQVRENCLEQAWVIDLDISKFFDEIDQELLMKAVEHMVEEKWVKMYVKRWLEMKVRDKEGVEHDREGKGTPQGGVISPLLANIFLHFALDRWLETNYPQTSFVRYADDVIVHCATKQQSEELLKAIIERLEVVKLKLNEKKSKIVYCKDYRRKDNHEHVQFGFLGFSYQPRRAKSKRQDNSSFTAFTAEMSKENQKRIRDEIKDSMNWRDTTMEITAIAERLNSKLRGWINYYGVYGKRSLRNTLIYLDERLIKWLQNKHKITSIRKAVSLFETTMKESPMLFYHWQKKYCWRSIK
jgi:RNA-directed DNA polymerase